MLKIISGGQTGVDRAALDMAIELGLPHGGRCPRGRRAEDGRIPDRYALVEDESPQYHVRTERNVLDADATLVLCRGELRGGTELTLRLALKHKKTSLVVDLAHGPDPAFVRAWLQRHNVATLNIAGPRESQAPGIGEEAAVFLRALLKGASR